jgi:hypothetical protein
MDALNFVNMGIGVIPVSWHQKTPEARLLPRDDDGPTWEPFKTRLPTEQDIKTWQVMTPNYGVVTGWQNLVVVDFDARSNYSSWLQWCYRRGGLAWLTAGSAFRVQTARGVHVYVRVPHIERTRKLDGIDIKASGGYVLGPGSTHPSGALYTPLKSAFIFPLIKTLSDILPVEVLTNDPSVIRPAKISPQPGNYDPWEAASNPGRIDGGVIERIRRTFRVEQFFTDLVKTGSHWYTTRCPFHADKRPSFWVDTERQICGCFTGCTSLPLDVINLYARLHSITNTEAIMALARMIEPQVT